MWTQAPQFPNTSKVRSNGGKVSSAGEGMGASFGRGGVGSFGIGVVEVELGSVEGQRVLNLVEMERKLDQVLGEME